MQRHAARRIELEGFGDQVEREQARDDALLKVSNGMAEIFLGVVSRFILVGKTVKQELMVDITESRTGEILQNAGDDALRSPYFVDVFGIHPVAVRELIP